MAAIIYSLCALTALTCAVLLLRAYARSKAVVLFWSGLCFAGLTLNNVFLVVDRIVLPEENLYTLRLGMAFVAVLLLLYGLIWGHD